MSPGDAKPREVVEDTAVAVEDLPAYIAEFDALMRGQIRHQLRLLRPRRRRRTAHAPALQSENAARA